MQAISVHLHCWIVRLNHKQGAKHEILKLQLNFRIANTLPLISRSVKIIRDNDADVGGLQLYWKLLGSSWAVRGCDADSLWHGLACVADRTAWQMLVSVSQHLLFSLSVVWHHEDHWPQSHLNIRPPFTHTHHQSLMITCVSAACIHHVSQIKIPPVPTRYNISSFLKINVTDKLPEARWS